MSIFWNFYSQLVKKYQLTKKDGICFIALGFARSGTSMIGQMLESAEVSFGQQKDMKQVDIRNPKGFFEHNDVFRLSRIFLTEAGFQDDLPDVTINFRAKGIVARMKRVYTRFRMQKVLHKIAQGKQKWGIKLFPNFLYFWKSYIPQRKVMAIYRNPTAVVESFMRAWGPGKFTAEQVLRFWTLANKDVLYHVTTNDAILISYEDIVDKEKRGALLPRIAEFTGGTMEGLEKVFDSNLNRSADITQALRKKYPFSQDMINVYNALEQNKLQ